MTRIIIAGARAAWGRPWRVAPKRSPALAIAGQFDLGQDLARFHRRRRRGR